jgi:hypothetical protein
MVGFETHETFIKACRYFLVNQHLVCYLTKYMEVMAQDGCWNVEFAQCQDTKQEILKAKIFRS